MMSIVVVPLIMALSEAFVYLRLAVEVYFANNLS